MVEFVSGALRMLSEQVGKIEKRLDEYHTRLKILEDDFDEGVDKDTVDELIDMVLAMQSCIHGKCQKCQRSEESVSDHHPKHRRTILHSSHWKIH